jgi:hypothetical protein
MAAPPEVQTKPVEDLGHRVDDAISVGEDLDFQEKWWKFENAVWWFFGFLIVCDLLGVFGRGVLAMAEAKTPDGALDMKYERIERTMTPSVLRLYFAPNAVHDGKYKLYVSASLVQELGNQRIAPQPEVSAVGDGGFIYTFPALGQPATVSLSLEPSAPGIYPIKIGVPGGQMIERKIVVVP